MSSEIKNDSKHEYRKYGGLGQTEWCAVCWKGGSGEIRHVDDPIHQFSATTESLPEQGQDAPKRIWIRRGTSQVMPLSDLEIETIGVGNAIEYIRADSKANEVGEYARTDGVVKLREEDQESGKRCTCRHQCPSREEWMDGAQCVHAPDCELMRQTAPRLSQSVISGDGSLKADESPVWATMTQFCGYCGCKVRHVCSAFLSYQ